MPDLPVWDCRTDRQRADLRRWTLRLLDGAVEARMAVGADADALEARAHEIEQAREILPYLTEADFDRLRKPQEPARRGAPIQPLSARITDLVEAALDVRLIRALWLQHYGRKDRTDAPTALSIAGERWGVDEQALETYLNRSGGRRPDLQLLRP